MRCFVLEHLATVPIIMTRKIGQIDTLLSRLLSLAESGEQIEITRHGKVVAVVTRANSATRHPGSEVGTVHYGDASCGQSLSRMSTSAAMRSSSSVMPPGWPMRSVAGRSTNFV